MLNNEQIETLNAGINLFNAKDFFEAHEFFEELWQTAETDLERAQFLFLVRLAAGGVHLINSNYSCLFLYDLAYKQVLEGLEIDFLDLSEFNKSLSQLIICLQDSSRAELQTIAQNLELKLFIKL